jgi:hypothetical protein
MPESRLLHYYVENGSYLKLRVLQLGYTVPKSISEKYSLENCRLYVSGQNLLIINSKNFTGVDRKPCFGYPLPMTFTVGINVSL